MKDCSVWSIVSSYGEGLDGVYTFIATTLMVHGWALLSIWQTRVATAIITQACNGALVLPLYSYSFSNKHACSRMFNVATSVNCLVRVEFWRLCFCQLMWDVILIWRLHYGKGRPFTVFSKLLNLQPITRLIVIRLESVHSVTLQHKVITNDMTTMES